MTVQDLQMLVSSNGSNVNVVLSYEPLSKTIKKMVCLPQETDVVPGLVPAEGSDGNGSESGASPARSSASEESWDPAGAGPLDGAALRRLAAERAGMLEHAPAPPTPRNRPHALHDDIDGIPGTYDESVLFISQCRSFRVKSAVIS